MVRGTRLGVLLLGALLATADVDSGHDAAEAPDTDPDAPDSSPDATPSRRPASRKTYGGAASIAHVASDTVEGSCVVTAAPR